MAKKRKADDEIPLYFGLTPNQVIAYNLAQARAWKDWTQKQACEALEPYLGTRWSTANYSLAERSIDGRNIRNFDADDIVAFARAFDLPISWFFLPPPPWAAPGIPTKLRTPDAEQFGAPLALLVDLVFGQDWQLGLMSLRLDAFLQDLGPNPLTSAQQQLVTLVNERKDKLVRHAVGDLKQWQTSLRALANHLEDLEVRSSHLEGS